MKGGMKAFEKVQQETALGEHILVGFRYRRRCQLRIRFGRSNGSSRSWSGLAMFYICVVFDLGFVFLMLYVFDEDVSRAGQHQK